MSLNLTDEIMLPHNYGYGVSFSKRYEISAKETKRIKCSSHLLYVFLNESYGLHQFLTCFRVTYSGITLMIM